MNERDLTGYKPSKPKAEPRKPSLVKLQAWVNDGVAEATDGCTVEPDGTCEHGKPSWLLKLGYI
jgi:hypothetical protein